MSETNLLVGGDSKRDTHNNKIHILPKAGNHVGFCDLFILKVLGSEVENTKKSV